MTRYVLRDLIASSLDGEWGKGEETPKHTPMRCIRGTDFAAARLGQVRGVPVRHIENHKAQRKVLAPWDILIEVAGGTKDQITGRTLLLRPRLFEEVAEPLTCASFSRFIKLRTDLCDPEFIFWYLQYLYCAGAMHAYHTQHTGVARFQWTTFADREPFDLPLLGVQRRIAGILSAYDDLIENCERRIRVLDEMARSLYREWFVLLRYPGHAKTPLVDSVLGRIPKGWTARPVKDLAETMYGFPFKSALFSTDSTDRTPVVRIRDIPVGASATYTNEAADARYEIQNGDILVGMDGDFHMTIWSNGRALQNQRVARFRPLDRWAVLHFFLALERPIQQLNASIVGTTVAHLGDMHIRDICLLEPCAELLQKSRKLFDPMSKETELLQQEVRNLRRTRDLLLPRLLSGQLPVEAPA